MYKRIIILLGLLAPAVATADRPAMSDRYSEAAETEPVTVEQAEPAATATEQIVVEQISGDVLEIQPGDTININPLDFPRRGMSMDKVQNELGRPVEISPTVGEPPISSWTYADRVVYFEYDKVIHVVEKR
jgi:hypothetical protein